MSDTSRCRGTNAKGRPCRMPRLKGGLYCWAHDPDRASERAEARRRGGSARARPGPSPSCTEPQEEVTLRSPGDVLAILERAAGDALSLPVDLGRARVLGYIASQATRTISLNDLEERLEALEEYVAQERSRRVGSWVP